MKTQQLVLLSQYFLVITFPSRIPVRNFLPSLNLWENGLPSPPPPPPLLHDSSLPHKPKFRRIYQRKLLTQPPKASRNDYPYFRSERAETPINYMGMDKYRDKSGLRKSGEYVGP